MHTREQRSSKRTSPVSQQQEVPMGRIIARPNSNSLQDIASKIAALVTPTYPAIRETLERMSNEADKQIVASLPRFA